MYSYLYPYSQECPNCGYTVSDWELYCPFCGEDLTKDIKIKYADNSGEYNNEKEYLEYKGDNE